MVPEDPNFLLNGWGVVHREEPSDSCRRALLLYFNEGLTVGPVTLRSCFRLRACLSFLLGSLGWPDDERNNGADQHDTGRDVEGEVVRAGYVRGDRQDQWTKEGGETPGGKHGPVDSPDVLGPEVRAGKGGHRAKATAIARQNDEREDREEDEHVPRH